MNYLETDFIPKPIQYILIITVFEAMLAELYHSIIIVLFHCIFSSYSSILLKVE